MILGRVVWLVLIRSWERGGSAYLFLLFLMGIVEMAFGLFVEGEFWEVG